MSLWAKGMPSSGPRGRAAHDARLGRLGLGQRALGGVEPDEGVQRAVQRLDAGEAGLGQLDRREVSSRRWRRRPRRWSGFIGRRSVEKVVEGSASGAGARRADQPLHRLDAAPDGMDAGLLRRGQRDAGARDQRVELGFGGLGRHRRLPQHRMMRCSMEGIAATGKSWREAATSRPVACGARRRLGWQRKRMRTGIPAAGNRARTARAGGTIHEGGRSDRRDPEARGRRDPHRLSGEPSHRVCRGRRHPPDHRAPGAHRPAHGGRDLPRHLRPARSACSACSTGRAPRTPTAAWPRPTASPCRSW